LREAGGGWYFRQAELTPEKLANELERLFNSPGVLVDAAGRAKALAPTDAVTKLADLAEGLAR
jgi:UDP-N-acetylglucosamine--N-acetylmuramyl-(pentapeptide) pyrophosphoryl-undecaprenol N-acetylglucosamine transferase